MMLCQDPRLFGKINKTGRGRVLKDMQSSLKKSLFTFIIVSFVIAVGFVRPSSAIGCNCGGVGAIMSTNTATSCACNLLNLEKTIMGKRALNKFFPIMVPDVDSVTGLPTGRDSIPIPQGATVMGLVDYFEDVFGPRMINLTQKFAQSQQMQSAAASQIMPRVIDAQSQVQHTQDTRRETVATAANALGREDVLCPAASRKQSMIAASIITEERTRLAQIESAKSVAGSLTVPALYPGMYATGPVDEAKKRLEKKVQLQACHQDGGAGVDGKWCPSGARAGWDTSLKTITGKYVLTPGSSIQNSIDFAKLFVANLFGPIMAISPLRADKVPSQLIGAVAEFQALRASHEAMVNTFIEPFESAIDERTENPGAASLAALDAVLTRAGFDATTKATYLASAGVSKAAMEEIHYRVANQDPKKLTDDAAKFSALNFANTLVMSLEQQIDSTVLLYEIREQIKTTNRLLGAIGNVLLDTRHDELQSRSRQLGASLN